MMNIKKSLEILTRQEATQVCTIDAKLQSSNPALYVRNNAEVWYVFINTWLLIIEQVSQRTRILVQEGIRRNGLIAMIKNGDENANMIMHSHADGSSEVNLSSYWLYLLADIAESADAERQVLTILRFGKRLSPAGANLVQANGISKFRAVNTHNIDKYYVQDAPTCSQYPMITAEGITVSQKDKENKVPDYDLEHKCSLWRDIQDEFNKLVPRWIFAERDKHPDDWGLSLIRILNGDGEFSNGSTYEHARTANQKVACMSLHTEQLDDFTFSYPITPEVSAQLKLAKVQYKSEPVRNMKNKLEWVFTQRAVEYKGRLTHFVPRKTRAERWEPYLVVAGQLKGSFQYLPNVCRIVAVPKSYKTPRIIAMEQTWRGFVMQSLRKALVSNLKDVGEDAYIDVEDQTPNQEWCRLGSIDRRYATIDLSSASDSIDNNMGYSIAPVLADFWDEIRSKYLEFSDGETIRSHIWLTSGTPVTFVLESMVFLSIARACTKYVAVFLSDDEEELLPPRTFGDDLIVDSRVYNTVVDVLSNLGFTVNVEKSFAGDSNYRESCGVEYLHGYPLDTVKWPRTLLTMNDKDCSPETLASMCSLQHKIFDLSWYAQKFLTFWVQDKCPRMTSSTPYTDCADLWSEEPTFGKRAACKGLSQQELSALDGSEPWYREAHMTPIAKYHTQSEYSPNLEMYKYMHFLKHGPSYACPLDRLLGITSKYDPATEYQLPKIEWRYVTRA